MNIEEIYEDLFRFGAIIEIVYIAYIINDIDSKDLDCKKYSVIAEVLRYDNNSMLRHNNISV